MKKHNYKARNYGAFVNGTWTIVKAYLKANAVTHLQLYDANVTASNVHLSSIFNSGSPVDEVIEEYDYRDGANVTYSIRMRSDFATPIQ